MELRGFFNLTQPSVRIDFRKPHPPSPAQLANIPDSQHLSERETEKTGPLVNLCEKDRTSPKGTGLELAEVNGIMSGHRQAFINAEVSYHLKITTPI